MMRPNLATLVDDWRRHGTQTAVVQYVGNRKHMTSYARLAQLAQSVATELAQREIGMGERVLLWGHNSAAWIGAYFGCVLRGALVVPIDAAGTSAFARRVADEVQPRLIIGDPDLLSLMDQTIPQLGLDDLDAMRISSVETSAADQVTLTRETPLQIVFTSGTTSEPKGIVHTHGNILASLDTLEKEIQRYRRYERPFHPLRFLHTLPLSHVFGQFMGLWLPPLLAAEVHFEDRLEADRLLRLIHHERITLLAAVPRVLQLLQAHLLTLDNTLPKQIEAAASLRWWQRLWRFRTVHRLFGWRFWAFVCGGAALPEPLERFWSALGFAVIQGYGMTETAALITLNHPFKIARGSIGKPLPGREIQIQPDGEVLVRGPMISTSTWQQGGLKSREDSWLATGDLVARDSTGELRFIGRKSEVIVTPAGMNIHPEDVEEVLMRQPGISDCAVVGVSIPGGGQQPVAVLLVPGGKQAAEQAILVANQQLAEFQRVRRWFLWPDSNLPRTSTGKIRRRPIADWAVHQISGSSAGSAQQAVDSLLSLISSLTGESIANAGNDSRLEEDLGIDSLGRMQLQSAIEQRFGTTIPDETLMSVHTLGELRDLLQLKSSQRSSSPQQTTVAPIDGLDGSTSASSSVTSPRRFIYPRWPWSPPVVILRDFFLELILRPLIWLFLKPQVFLPDKLQVSAEPSLLIANHVTVLDVPLVLYALPRRMRKRIAVAAAGEMIEDWRHGRNQPTWWQNVLAPMQYWLLTALFNIFPLPRQAGFRDSFSHIGHALDQGYSVLIFPEGRRSPDGKLLSFRSGIGMLVQDSHTAILPVALCDMDALVGRQQPWLHSGLIKIKVGHPITLKSAQSSQEITAQLHDTLKEMLS